MTKLSTIPDHTLSITGGLCKHHTMLELANTIRELSMPQTLRRDQTKPAKVPSHQV